MILPTTFVTVVLVQLCPCLLPTMPSGILLHKMSFSFSSSLVPVE